MACSACVSKSGARGTAQYLPAVTSSFICLVLLIRILLIITVTGIRLICIIFFFMVIHLAKMPVGWATGFLLPLLCCCIHLSILLRDAKVTLLLLRVIA